MDMGIDFSKILIILVLILVFFGSKEIPRLLREGARLYAKVRKYSDRVKQEINSITATVGSPVFQQSDSDTYVKKQELRKQYIAIRRAMDPKEREEKSKLICDHLESMEEFKKARSVMIYVTMGAEVDTRPLIRKLLLRGIKVVVPYSKSESRDMGIAAITDLDNDMLVNGIKSSEPKNELRDNFFRSDLQFVVCPGVAFDSLGGRLGRGRAYYDTFLKEIDGRVPIVGLAFNAQIVPGQLPFSYSDMAMRQIITETGLLMEHGIGAYVARPATGAEASAATPGETVG
jgi:5-formyltetrahydrofolate cyclo-ligase